MTPEQVYESLLKEIAQVEEIIKSNPNEGKEGVILLNKERMMTAVVKGGRLSEAFRSLEPQHFSVGHAKELRKCWKDINNKIIRMELVSDEEYYTLLLEKMNFTAKAFQNVYGY